MYLVFVFHEFFFKFCREIFNKYIQRPGEHSDSVKPFVSDDPELCHGEKDRNQDEFLMDPNR